MDELGEKLWIAVEKGDLSEVKRVLQRGADCNWRNPADNQLTPVHVACVVDSPTHVAILALLLDYGGHTEVKGDGNSTGFETPLECACAFGSLGAVQLLLDRKADMNFINSVGLTPLHAAVYSSSLSILRLLLSRSSENVNVKGPDGKTALQWALREEWALRDGSRRKTPIADSFLMVEALIDAGASVPSEDWTAPRWVKEHRIRNSQCQVARRALGRALRKEGTLVKDVIPLIMASVWDTRKDPCWLRLWEIQEK